MTTSPTPALLALATTLASLSSLAHADTTSVPAAADHAFHLDVEVDPTAYVMSGYSVHAGIGWNHLRLDLGVYAMDLPEFIHGNDGWDASFDGAGAKLQWFPFAEQRGAFVDVSVGVSRQKVTVTETGASQRDTSLGLGAAIGWRFWLPYSLYVTPWAGFSYSFDADDVMLDGKAFEKSSVLPFAAVHVGFRFR